MKIVTSIGLGILSLASIGLITWFDDRAADLFVLIGPEAQWAAWIRLPSLILCFTLYRLTRPNPAVSDTSLSDRGGSMHRVFLKIYPLWLLPAALAILGFKVWVPALPHWIDLVAFLGTGLLAEEFLFRGAIYQLFDRLYKVRLRKIPLAVFYSAFFFGLQHLQFHHFQISRSSLIQISYTMLAGIFFAMPRALSGKIWPCILLHVLNNLLVFLRLNL